MSFCLESGFICLSFCRSLLRSLRVIFHFSPSTHLDLERLRLSLEWDLLLRGLLDLLLLLERDRRRDRLLERLQQSMCLQNSANGPPGHAHTYATLTSTTDRESVFSNLYLERDLDLFFRDLDLDLECFLLSSFLSEKHILIKSCNAV